MELIYWVTSHTKIPTFHETPWLHIWLHYISVLKKMNCLFKTPSLIPPRKILMSHLKPTGVNEDSGFGFNLFKLSSRNFKCWNSNVWISGVQDVYTKWWAEVPPVKYTGSGSGGEKEHGRCYSEILFQDVLLSAETRNIRNFISQIFLLFGFFWACTHRSVLWWGIS